MQALINFCTPQGNHFNHFSSSQVLSSIIIYYFGSLLQIDNDNVIITMLQKHILEDHWRKVPLLHFRICSNFFIFYLYFQRGYKDLLNIFRVQLLAPLVWLSLYISLSSIGVLWQLLFMHESQTELRIILHYGSKNLDYLAETIVYPTKMSTPVTSF
jgi:hypothetical protein